MRFNPDKRFLDKINKINKIQLSDSRQGEGKSSGQKPFAFRLYCSAGVSPAWVSRSMAGEKPDLHKCL